MQRVHIIYVERELLIYSHDMHVLTHFSTDALLSHEKSYIVTFLLYNAE